jgi:hypothetical protein
MCASIIAKMLRRPRPHREEMSPDQIENVIPNVTALVTATAATASSFCRTPVSQDHTVISARRGTMNGVASKRKKTVPRARAPATAPRVPLRAGPARFA